MTQLPTVLYVEDAPITACLSAASAVEGFEYWKPTMLSKQSRLYKDKSGFDLDGYQYAGYRRLYTDYG
jgi:hypothetical protein